MSFLDYKMNPSKTATHPRWRDLVRIVSSKENSKKPRAPLLIRNAEINAEMDADLVSVHGDAPN